MVSLPLFILEWRLRGIDSTLMPAELDRRTVRLLPHVAA
jgi:hypothetical protein